MTILFSRTLQESSNKTGLWDSPISVQALTVEQNMRSMTTNVMKVLTDDGEADPGVTGRRLPEVDTTPVLPLVALVHVVQRQGGWVSDSEEVSAFIQDLLVFPVRRHLRVLPTDVKAVDKRQCQPQFQDYLCSILFLFKDGSDHI